MYFLLRDVVCATPEKIVYLARRSVQHRLASKKRTQAQVGFFLDHEKGPNLKESSARPFTVDLR